MSFRIRKTISQTIIETEYRNYTFQNGYDFIPANNKFIIRLFKDDINKYYEQFGHDFFYTNEFIINDKNVDNCIKYKNEIITAFDVNSCYWTAAYNLNFITEKTYNRGIFFKLKDLDVAAQQKFICKTKYQKAKDLNLTFDQSFEQGFISEDNYRKGNTNLKHGLLVAVGSLTKNINIDIYEKGKLIVNTVDYEYMNKYRPFHRAILSYVDKFLIELSKLDGYCFFKTDCVYFANINNCESKVKELFKKYKFTYKSFNNSILSVINKEIIYFDYNKNKKLKV